MSYDSTQDKRTPSLPRQVFLKKGAAVAGVDAIGTPSVDDLNQGPYISPAIKLGHG